MGYLKWLALFGIEIAGATFAVISNQASAEDDVKKVVSQLVRLQKESGDLTQYFFLAIMCIIVLQMFYGVFIGCKRCMKKNVKQALNEA